MTEAKGEDLMTDVPDVAQQMAGRLAEAFDRDRGLAEQLNDCQDRLRAANGRLWTGHHPDALGLLYDDTAAVGVRQGGSGGRGHRSPRLPQIPA